MTEWLNNSNILNYWPMFLKKDIYQFNGSHWVHSTSCFSRFKENIVHSQSLTLSFFKNHKTFILPSTAWRFLRIRLGCWTWCGCPLLIHFTLLQSSPASLTSRPIGDVDCHFIPFSLPGSPVWGFFLIQMWHALWRKHWMLSCGFEFLNPYDFPSFFPSFFSVAKCITLGKWLNF